MVSEEGTDPEDLTGIQWYVARRFGPHEPAAIKKRFLDAQGPDRTHCLPGCNRLDGHDGWNPGACMRDGRLITEEASALGLPLGLAALEFLVARVRYKPGWGFAVRPADWPTADGTAWSQEPLAVLEMGFPVPDAVRRGEPRTQRVQFTVPPYPDITKATVERWAEWLFGVICNIETHEAAEFFGILVDDQFGGTRYPSAIVTQEGLLARPFEPHHDGQKAANAIAQRGLLKHIS